MGPRWAPQRCKGPRRLTSRAAVILISAISQGPIHAAGVGWPPWTTGLGPVTLVIAQRVEGEGSGSSSDGGRGRSGEAAQVPGLECTLHRPEHHTEENQQQD